MDNATSDQLKKMRKVIPIIKAETLIPKGCYCYTPVQAPCEENNWVYKIKCCPFWEHYDAEKHGPLPEDWIVQGDSESPGAYCRYLKLGDWMEEGTFLLWDQVKECGINDDWDDEDYQ